MMRHLGGKLHLCSDFKEEHQNRIRNIVREFDGLTVKEIEELLILVREVLQEDSTFKFKEEEFPRD